MGDYGRVRGIIKPAFYKSFEAPIGALRRRWRAFMKPSDQGPPMGPILSHQALPLDRFIVLSADVICGDWA